MRIDNDTWDVAFAGGNVTIPVDLYPALEEKGFNKAIIKKTADGKYVVTPFKIEPDEKVVNISKRRTEGGGDLTIPQEISKEEKKSGRTRARITITETGFIITPYKPQRYTNVAFKQR